MRLTQSVLCYCLGLMLASLSAAPANALDYSIQLIDGMGLCNDFNNGEVVVGGTANQHPILWMEGVATDILPNIGAYNGQLFSVSDNGWLSGTAKQTVTAPSIPFVYEIGSNSRIVLPQLSTYGGAYNTSINENGVVAGASKVLLSPYVISHAVKWEKDASDQYQVSDLGLPPGYVWAFETGVFNAWSSDINVSGKIVGTLNYDPPPSFGASYTISFLWADGEMIELPAMYLRLNTNALSINDSNVIVGNHSTDQFETPGGNRVTHAVKWEKIGGTWVISDLDSRPNDSSWAFDSNAQGKIVGSYKSNGLTYAGIWENGELIDLTSRIPANSGWSRLDRAIKINANGAIIGYGVYGGVTRSFLLMPNVNQPPVINPIPNQIIGVGEQLTFTVSAADPDAGSTVNLSAFPLPNGATFTENGDGTALFNWRPGKNQAGNYTITVQATDGELTASSEITVRVNQQSNLSRGLTEP